MIKAHGYLVLKILFIINHSTSHITVQLAVGTNNINITLYLNMAVPSFWFN